MVSAELGRNKSPQSRILQDTAEHGLVQPLNETSLSAIRDGGISHQSDVWGTPILTDQLPLDNDLSTTRIQAILHSEIASGSTFFVASSRSSSLKDARAAFDFINKIDDPQYNEPGAALFVHAPAFEQLHMDKFDWPEDGVLGDSAVTMELTAAGNVHEMEHYDDYMLSTLLIGAKVWFTFPPTTDNLNALQIHHKTLTKDVEMSALDRIQNFEHGIAIVQQAGQVLILPPFWLATSLSTQNAVSCMFRIATALTFDQRIINLKHFRQSTQFDLVDGVTGQQNLFSFAEELIEDLQVILEGNLKGCNLTKVISNICRLYETLRFDLRGILEAIEDKAITRGLQNKYHAVWLKFLEQKRKKSSKCRLCNLRIQHMPSGANVRIQHVPSEASPTDRLRQHFADHHCLRDEL